MNLSALENNTVLLWSVLGVILGVLAIGIVWVVIQKVHERKHPEDDETPTIGESLEETAELSVSAGQKADDSDVADETDTSDALRELPPDETVDKTKKK